MKLVTLSALLSLCSLSWGALMNNCHEDNVFRFLLNPTFRKTASQFCSTYIQSTTTTTATFSPLATRISLVTLPDSFTTSTIPSTVTTTSTEIDVVTSPDPTVEATVVTTIAFTSIIMKKRAPVTSVPVPLTMYPASRLSSACSCFLSAAATATLVRTSTRSITTTTTSTVPAATDIISVTIVTTAYALEIDTSSVAATSTVTAYTTQIVPNVVETIYCGIRGPGNLSVYAAVILPEQPLSTPAVCLALCLANSGCFSILLTSTNCVLLSQPVAAVFGSPVADYDQIWYDRDCPTA